MRSIYMTAFAALAATAIFAVDTSAQTIGFKLGAAFANMSSDETGATSDGITGFSGGGHIRFGLGGRIGVQAEVLSVTKGANFTNTAGQGYDYRFEYVELPLTLFVPLSAGNVAPFVFGGAALGLEVRCRVTPTGTGAGVGTERDCGDSGVGMIDSRSPDISLVGGGGLAMAMGPGALLIEGRYTAGMRSVIETAGAADLRHRAVSVMAGYEIPLGRRW